jgi:Cu/Ag efflux protein CusF
MKHAGFVSVAWFALAPLATFAQNPVSLSNVLETTEEVVAIDHDARLVTLENSEGESDTFYAGPEIKRFDELKVGDKITFRYQESLVTSIRKPGGPAPKIATGAPSLMRGKGAKPSASAAQQLNVTVTLTEIDAKAPSVTVKTEEGRKMSFKVADKKNLEGYKVGDKVDITYTAAVIITVK